MSLTELLASLAVLGLVAAASLTLLQETQRVYAVAAARAESQQAARVALERLAREVRLAGAGAADAAFPAISRAERSRIDLHVDLDGDGTIAGNGETVVWRLAGSVLRRSAGGGAQPIIDGVRDLTLAYLDAEGRPTTLPDVIRTVLISLTTEAEYAASGLAPGVATTFSTEVRLRNR